MSDIVNKKIDSNLSRHVRQLHGVDDLYPYFDRKLKDDCYFERRVLESIWWGTLNRWQTVFYRIFFWLQPFRK